MATYGKPADPNLNLGTLYSTTAEGSVVQEGVGTTWLPAGISRVLADSAFYDPASWGAWQRDFMTPEGIPPETAAYSRVGRRLPVGAAPSAGGAWVGAPAPSLLTIKLNGVIIMQGTATGLEGINIKSNDVTVGDLSAGTGTITVT